ncbi:hypothetical protein I5535_10970 [Rhodobacteraceae bacterium F11138]|nr:hypothetical protein [Rhodobacteraceae bacterium F11138]
MKLQDPRLEDIHTKLKSTLVELRDEHARCRDTDDPARGDRLDGLAMEIENWAEDASKAQIDPDNDETRAGFLERAREIELRLTSERTMPSH